jgi:hypothetical protein
MPICKIKFPQKINVSLILTVLACMAPLALLMTESKPQARRAAGGGYIMLVAGEHIPDRLVAEKLKETGLKDVLSESSQWFFLNSFSELRSVPLDELSDSLIETDPRNDGYAQRLRSLFVRDGKRYFYIPQSSFHSSDHAVIEQRVRDALGDTPYSDIAYGEYSFNDLPGAFIFASAALLCFVVSAFVSRRAGSRRSVPALLLPVAALMPSCALLAGAGASGFALAAVMMALVTALDPQLKSFFMARRLASGFSACKPPRIGRLFLGEKRLWLLLLVMIFTVCLTGQAAAPRVLSAVLFFCLSAAAAAREESAPKDGHIRFFPVAIRQDAGERHRPALMALPFTLASIAALALSLAAGPQTGIAVPPGRKLDVPVVDADDYAAHIEFQRNFSLRRLGADGGQNGYTDFVIGADGLFHPAGDASPSPAPIADGNPPPFPLERLAGFLEGDGESVQLPVVFDIRALIAVVIGAALYLPVPVFTSDTNRKKERNKLYLTQRVSA